MYLHAFHNDCSGDGSLYVLSDYLMIKFLGPLVTPGPSFLQLYIPESDMLEPDLRGHELNEQYHSMHDYGGW